MHTALQDNQKLKNCVEIVIFFFHTSFLEYAFDSCNIVLELLAILLYYFIIWFSTTLINE